MKKEHIETLIEVAGLCLKKMDNEYLGALANDCGDYDLLEKMEEEIAKWTEIIEDLEEMKEAEE